MSRLCVLMLMIGVTAWSAPGWAQAERVDAPKGATDPAPAPSEALAADAPEQEESSQSATPKMTKTWEEIVADFLKVRPVSKEKIIRIDEQYCFPHKGVSFKMEIVREDDDTVWVRGLPPENPESALHKLWLRREAQQRDYLMLEEKAVEYGMTANLIDVTAEVPPAPFMDGLSFTKAPGTMPNDGRWQMNFAVDDMNGDGLDDLVFPPTRKGSGQPFIFLGTGTGEFTVWEEVKWASGVSYDYGGVATGDFDGDGHRDVVLAVHFKPQYVLFGDGKGGFERSRRLPSPDPRMTSRAPVVADFNGDGRDDVAFQAELDVELGTNERITDVPTLWVVLNLENGWQLQTAGLPSNLIGDNLAVRDLDQDGRPDLVVAPGTLDWRALVYFNRGDNGWEQIPEWEGVLSYAYHFDVDSYREGDEEQLFAAFAQFQTVDGETKALTGVIPYRLGQAGLESRGGPIYYDDQRFNPVWRVAVGDLTGDGRPDLVVSRKSGGLMVFVQTASGEFYLEQSPELVDVGCAYDIRLLDLNGDGLDDVVASFVPAGEQPGGVRVWLTGKSA